jgi:hypothetical protein
MNFTPNKLETLITFPISEVVQYLSVVSFKGNGHPKNATLESLQNVYEA